MTRIPTLLLALATTFVVACDAEPETPVDETIQLDMGLFADLVTQDLLRVDVCEPTTGNCGVSDITDGLLIDVPKDERFELELTLDGYAPVLVSFPPLADDTESVGSYMLNDATVELFASQADITVDDSLGTVVFLAGSPGAAGSLSPMAGEGPYYQNDIGFVDPEATVTGAVSGVAYFNVPEGEYTIEADVDGTACAFLTPDDALPTSQTLQVRGGWLSAGFQGACN